MINNIMISSNISKNIHDLIADSRAETAEVHAFADATTLSQDQYDKLNGIKHMPPIEHATDQQMELDLPIETPMSFDSEGGLQDYCYAKYDGLSDDMFEDMLVHTVANGSSRSAVLNPDANHHPGPYGHTAPYVNEEDQRALQAGIINSIATEQAIANQSIITDQSHEEFYQSIADAAKEWTSRASDKRKLKGAMTRLLSLGIKGVSVHDSDKLADRLKDDECIRIITDLVNHLNKDTD